MADLAASLLSLTRATLPLAIAFQHARASSRPKPSPEPLGLARDGVAKMASHAIFQYNVLAIDDTHNTWTNVIVKMTILRLLGSSDDKEKIGTARPSRVLGQRPESSSVQETRIEAFCYHRLNRRREK